jgi:hypothetical protein
MKRNPISVKFGAVKLLNGKEGAPPSTGSRKGFPVFEDVF